MVSDVKSEPAHELRNEMHSAASWLWICLWGLSSYGLGTMPKKM
jgi:hypothetical protein